MKILKLLERCFRDNIFVLYHEVAEKLPTTSLLHMKCFASILVRAASLEIDAMDYCLYVSVCYIFSLNILVYIFSLYNNGPYVFAYIISLYMLFIYSFRI